MSKEALEFFKGNQQAADIFMRKYANKKKGETSPTQLFKRISSELNRKEEERNNFFNGYDDKRNFSNLSEYGKIRFGNYFEDEIKFLDLSEFISFNKITLGGSANEGLGSPELFSSLSNCLVIGQPHDSVAGIFKKRTEMSFAFQRRMGAGIDISTLRPKGAALNNQAKHSSGAVSFAHGFSETTKEIAQDSRRGALMISMNILHTDSLEFITSKIDKTKITGANISLLIDDEFMQAVVENKEILLRFPVELDVTDLKINDYVVDELTQVAKGKYVRRVSAKTYWDKLIECAHASAEPGVIFIGNWKRGGLDWEYPQYRPVTTNPCVAGDTKILTDKGYFPIKDLVGKKVNIWNGEEWSEVEPQITGENQEMLKITLSNGEVIRCTNYHTWFIFHVAGNYGIEAKDLEIGDMISKFQLPMLDENGLPSQHFDVHHTLKITNIEKDGIDEKVYCFNEPKKHSGIFNGVLLGNCSEIPMPEYDACRLLAFNLYSLVENPFTQQARFVSNDKIYRYFYEQMVIGDLIIDLELEYLQNIIDKISNSDTPKEEKEMELSFFNKIMRTTEKSRRVGCGFTGLGDMLAAMSFNYYSPVAIQEIFHTKMKAELDATIDMAILFGTFESFDFELENQNEYMRMIEREFPKQFERMKIHGRRNVSLSTAAPTGTTSMMTETTSGIEPLFKPYYVRRVKCLSENDRVDFVDSDGQKFTNHHIIHPKLVDFAQNSELVPYATREDLESMDKEILDEVYVKKSPWHNNCADDLNWKQRVEIQSIVQRYTTHAISSTINLPEDVAPEKISEIYIESWKHGLKGNTVYREGSRGGILVSDKNAKNASNSELNFDEIHNQFVSLCENDNLNDSEIETMFKTMPAQKRPKVLNAVLETFKSRKKIYTIVIGLLNHRPFEIFVLSDVENLSEDTYMEGTITKTENNQYVFEETGGRFEINNLGDMEKDEKLISLLISSSLRHRAPIDYIQKLIEKSEPIAGTFAHRLNKILSKYIDEKEVKSTKEICKSCGGEIVRENGCHICKSCGASKC